MSIVRMPLWSLSPGWEGCLAMHVRLATGFFSIVVIALCLALGACEIL